MNQRPKTCLMVLDNPFSPDHRPRREIETLAASGWCIAMLCEKGGGLPEEETRAGVAICRIDPPWRVSPFSLRTNSDLARLIDRVRSTWPLGFQVVHCHDWLTLPYAHLLARALGARLVYDSHEYFAGIAKRGGESFRSRLRHWLRLWREDRALRHVDLLITVSPTISNWFRERRGFLKPVVVLNNMPDWNVESQADVNLRAHFGIPIDALLLVHGGNIRFNTRRIDVVVQSLAEVANCHLLCVGTGEDAKLKTLASAAGVADRVHHLPAVSYHQLGSVLAACDIGLSVLQPDVPNHEAALPNKLFEYLSAGIPVLGSPLAEQRTFLESERVGWTMSELSPSACAEALRSARKELPATRERVILQRSRYTWSSQDEMLVSAYANLSK